MNLWCFLGFVLTLRVSLWEKFERITVRDSELRKKGNPERYSERNTHRSLKFQTFPWLTKSYFYSVWRLWLYRFIHPIFAKPCWLWAKMGMWFVNMLKRIFSFCSNKYHHQVLQIWSKHQSSLDNFFSQFFRGHSLSKVGDSLSRFGSHSLSQKVQHQKLTNTQETEPALIFSQLKLGNSHTSWSALLVCSLDLWQLRRSKPKMLRSNVENSYKPKLIYNHCFFKTSQNSLPICKDPRSKSRIRATQFRLAFK